MNNDEYNKRHLEYHVAKLKKAWEREDVAEDEWGCAEVAEWRRYVPQDVEQVIKELFNYKPIPDKESARR